MPRCLNLYRELYTIFNEIVKATYVGSRAAYRLKIIVRTRSINDQFLALIRILFATLYVMLQSLITNFFFGENKYSSGGLWANLDPISIKYQVVSLIDELFLVF